MSTKEEEIVKCCKCGEPAQPGTDPPLCDFCINEATWGDMDNPKTADEEMKAMEARDVNEDEGDK